MKSREEVATRSQRGEPWLRDAGKMRAMSESDVGVRRIYIKKKKKSTVIREQPEPSCSEGAQPGPPWHYTTQGLKGPSGRRRNT